MPCPDLVAKSLFNTYQSDGAGDSCFYTMYDSTTQDDERRYDPFTLQTCI
jgi:hypothetical protein